MNKPSIPRGTRDFNPQEMARRTYIFNTIKRVYEQHGYVCIETPAMEMLSTLTGKYGDEGDQLLFKILNSRMHESKKKDDLTAVFQRSLQQAVNSDLLTERALRYDLTVPFARYVVMHQHELNFPFKRYQIQPVWRADNPQKGRYREFYQCDADVIGSSSLFNELELLMIIDEVFIALGLRVVIKLNNRKILTAISQLIDADDKIIDITVAIDKLDKIGRENVIAELYAKGLTTEAIEALQPIIFMEGNNEQKLQQLLQVLNNDAGKAGIEELRYIYQHATQCLSSNCSLQLDITLARGLNYYTGAIIEVQVDDPRSAFASSICGGGRYDDLTGIFGLKNMSGVDISFGADRIYDVLLEAQLFPHNEHSGTTVLFANFGNEGLAYCLPLLHQLITAGVSATIYPDHAKMKKQMSYANDCGVRYVVLAGESEMAAHTVTVKHMGTGAQHTIDKTTLTSFINSQA